MFSKLTQHHANVKAATTLLSVAAYARNRNELKTSVRIVARAINYKEKRTRLNVAMIHNDEILKEPKIINVISVWFGRELMFARFSREPKR